MTTSVVPSQVSAAVARAARVWILTLALGAALAAAEAPPPAPTPAPPASAAHLEVPDDPYVAVPASERVTAPARRWQRGRHVSVQVNVDGNGNNVVNDAANEPSLAVDPTDPQRIVIGWRQFDTITSNFRQAGWGRSTDGGATWTAGKLTPGMFRSDPVLEADAEGNVFYYSLEGNLDCSTFTSTDGGASWSDPVYSFGGDKAWIAVDPTAGVGAGNLYAAWSPNAGCCGTSQFNRSVDSAESFESPVNVPNQPMWGTTAVGPDGTVYVTGRRSGNTEIVVTRSSTVQNPDLPQTFQATTVVDLGGLQIVSAGPNPGGLLGQIWIAADLSTGTPTSGNLYLLASLDPPGDDPLDVFFARSTDGGATWSPPQRVNDDPTNNNAWQWFATLSVAPNGRLDAIWNDTRNDPGGFDSELYYTWSQDGGHTWSASEPLSPPFDPHVGWPQQNKIGDYYDMVSDGDGAHLAYSATFNGEQDVYYLRILNSVLFADGFESGDTSGWSG